MENRIIRNSQVAAEEVDEDSAGRHGELVSESEQATGGCRSQFEPLSREWEDKRSQTATTAEEQLLESD